MLSLPLVDSLVLHFFAGFTQAIFPTQVYVTPTHYYDSTLTFYTIANVGLILFMFLMGMELDQGLLSKQWKMSLPIATSAIVFPFGIGALSALWLADVNAEGQTAEWVQPSNVAYTLFAGKDLTGPAVHD